MHFRGIPLKERTLVDGPAITAPATGGYHVYLAFTSTIFILNTFSKQLPSAAPAGPRKAYLPSIDNTYLQIRHYRL